MHLNPLALRLHFGRGIAATAKTMEWTNDDALELIEQYRHHTELWNRADPKYKDKLCRFRAWSEIAERFGCSKAEVERKMNVLLTQYRREKHKMLVKMYQGINPNPSKWYAFKRFDFMESGGGSASSSSSGGLLVGATTNGTANTANSNSNSSSVNGHSAAAAAAAVAALSGLTGNSFDASSITITPSTSHHHRRVKSKEMKYFGAMGLNLPMLVQPLETSVWSSAVGQYSPPISERNHQLRVPLSMSYSATQNELNVANETTRSLFGGSNSGNSDLAVSPQKPMDTADSDDKDATKRELHSSPMAIAAMHPSDRGGGASCAADGNRSGNAREDDGGAGAEATDIGSSPIPNTNTHEAHQLRLIRRDNRDQTDLDIKQELVDYFHAPHPPAPPDSHRSFSSTEEMRLIGMGGGPAGAANGPGCDSDEYAQDLRVSAAAAVTTKRGFDLSHLIMASAHNRRRSTESLEEKYTPLNMRKVSTTSSTTTTGAGASATSTHAGHVLMNSLLSNESMSEDTMASGQQRVKSVVSQDAGSTSAAAAAAATLYAESLRRDDCDFIGSNVSVKLRAMDRSQRIIAEKLISEVLFYGQFNELERSARIQPK